MKKILIYKKKLKKFMILLVKKPINFQKEQKKTTNCMGQLNQKSFQKLWKALTK